MDHGLRRARLADRLEELGIDALLVTRLPNVRYLTGFTGSNGQVLIGGGGHRFFTDGRYIEQSRHEVDGCERAIYLGELDGPLADACAEMGVTRLGFEDRELSVRRHAVLAAALEGVELIPAGDVVDRDRWVKDADELRALREAQACTDRAFDDVLDRLALGMTERQAALELEQAVRRAGGDGLAFASIVAFGEGAAEPHHRPGHRVLEEGDVVVMDFGALYEGYHADFTRTVGFGEPPAVLRKVHDLVREAQQAAIDAIAPGVSGGGIDAVARGTIEDGGYGDRFTHGLGHGVGLEIHEGPDFARDGEDPIPEGAVMTVEPGIYVPGLGGVRIEDMVAVTGEGADVLSTSTRELIEL
ncbi:MAG: Xaa-Pro peptidase family protein [Actinomycetota bacterium]